MRLLILLATISLACLLLTGCWDLQEITDLAPIIGLGFDAGNVPGTIRVLFQTTPPTVGAAGGLQGGVSLRVITVEAATLTEAVTVVLGHIRRDTFLMHLGFIVFGEELARTGIGAVIAGMHGRVDIRGSVPVLVAAGSAEAVLRARSGVGRSPGQDILNLLANIRGAPIGPRMTFYEVISTLTGLGGEIALPILDLTPLRIEAGDFQPADGTGQQGQQLMEVVVGRTALFKRDRWVHELDVYQTQIFILLRGDVTQGTQSIVHPTAPGGAMALHFLRFRAEFSPRVLGKESVSLPVKIDIVASLSEVRAGYDLRQHGPQPILEVLEAHVTAETIELLSLLQQLGVDSLGIGNMIYRRQPQVWRQVEAQWEELYRQTTVSVETKARLRDTSMIVRPFAVRRQ